MAKLLLVAGSILLLALFCGGSPSKIHPRLEKSLQEANTGTVNVLVSFSGKGSTPAEILNQLRVKSVSFTAQPRPQRLATISFALKENAQVSQQAVLDWLAQNQLDNSVKKVQSLWITNQIYVGGANRALIVAIAEFPEVSHITEDEVRQIETTAADFHGEVSLKRRDGILAESWGIDNIRAPAVWNSPGGNQGEGVIVASIDTGVRGTHEALVDNFLGPYGWLDPFESSLEPSDMIGQGTHAMGTMVGSQGIGVAPGARWAACMACDFTCPISMLLRCGEYFVCPDPDCELAPHIITNGWRAQRGDNFYDDVIRTWRAGGIIPIFTNGNVGPTCSTATSPGDSVEGVIAVSLSNSTDHVADRSSKGPGASGAIKPDLVAPGELIISASNQGDTQYTVLSGVAQPHVGGSAALLLSHNANFTFDHVQKLLADGAAKWIPSTGLNCGGVSESLYPNNAVGNGKVDAFRSFMLASGKMLSD